MGLPGPLIIRLTGNPAGRSLTSRGKAALLSRYGLDVGSRVRVWVEEHGKWVDGVVVESYRVNYSVLEKLFEYSGYGSVEEWVSAAEKAGGMFGWVLVVERVEEPMKQ